MARLEHTRPEIQEILDHEAEGTTDELPDLQSHDWEPGTETHPMHTDPMCIHCGLSKNAPIHRCH